MHAFPWRVGRNYWACAWLWPFGLNKRKFKSLEGALRDRHSGWTSAVSTNSKVVGLGHVLHESAGTLRTDSEVHQDVKVRVLMCSD